MHNPSRRTLLAELLLIFGAVPLVVSLLKPHSWIYLMLWVLGYICYKFLAKHDDYTFRTDWNFGALDKAVVKGICLRFLPCAVILLLFAWYTIPDRFFSLPRDHPIRWLMVMALYPPLSAVPQEIIYRSFFFRRYKNVISPVAMNMASALAFGWIHLVLQNWVAVIFSIAGGFLFADTYSKTRSLAASCFEHALYGCYIFTIGMGAYFYHGLAVR